MNFSCIVAKLGFVCNTAGSLPAIARVINPFSFSMVCDITRRHLNYVYIPLHRELCLCRKSNPTEEGMQ